MFLLDVFVWSNSKCCNLGSIHLRTFLFSLLVFSSWSSYCFSLWSSSLSSSSCWASSPWFSSLWSSSVWSSSRSVWFSSRWFFPLIFFPLVFFRLVLFPVIFFSLIFLALIFFLVIFFSRVLSFVFCCVFRVAGCFLLLSLSKPLVKMHQSFSSTSGQPNAKQTIFYKPQNCTQTRDTFHIKDFFDLVF